MTTTIYSKAGADAAISAATDALTPEDVGADPAGTAAAAIAALGLADATAAGRTLLTAADAKAQRAALEIPLAITYGPGGATSMSLATTHTRADLASNIVCGKDEATGKLYGQVLPSTNFSTSTDGGATFTDTGVNPYVAIGTAPQQIQLTTSYMYVTTATAKIWRAPKDTFSGSWTDISVPGLPAATTGRTSNLAISGDGAVLLYCNYNSSPTPAEGAFVWRSTDNGATWTKVYDLASPAAKHAHAIKFDPWHAGHAYLSAGDIPYPSAGLHRSTDYGATWAPCALTARSVGIDMAFPAPIAGVPEMILLEGDVMQGAQVYVYYKGTDRMVPLIWYTGALADPWCTVASARGIALTPDGDLIYFTTTESYVFGPRAGIYVARGPWYRDSILLQDITGEEPLGYVQTVISGTNVIQRGWKFNVPTFGK